MHNRDWQSYKLQGEWTQNPRWSEAKQEQFH
jgi:hypothetical protein